jgi:hypothetical protein
MAPVAVSPTTATEIDVTSLKAELSKLDSVTLPPENALRRYKKAAIDLTKGYPYFPEKPTFTQEVKKVREDVRATPYVDPATRADPEKTALFGAATAVRNLTTNIGVSNSEG